MVSRIAEARTPCQAPGTASPWSRSCPVTRGRSGRSTERGAAGALILLLDHQLAALPIDREAAVLEELAAQDGVAAHPVPPQLARVERPGPARDLVVHDRSHRHARHADLVPLRASHEAACALHEPRDAARLEADLLHDLLGRADARPRQPG